jgi:hypothetical protein
MKTVELYARVRRAVLVDGMSRRVAAREFGLHPRAKTCSWGLHYQRPKLGTWQGVIDAILEDDKQRPRKQPGSPASGLCLMGWEKQTAVYWMLIIDELGYVPLSKPGAELLFETISQRYERNSTLITSNLPFDEWTEIFGSERLTGALLDRLTHHVHILEMNGDSYRLKQSRHKQA